MMMTDGNFRYAQAVKKEMSCTKSIRSVRGAFRARVGQPAPSAHGCPLVRTHFRIQWLHRTRIVILTCPPMRFSVIRRVRAKRWRWIWPTLARANGRSRSLGKLKPVNYILHPSVASTWHRILSLFLDVSMNAENTTNNLTLCMSNSTQRNVSFTLFRLKILIFESSCDRLFSLSCILTLASTLITR